MNILKVGARGAPLAPPSGHPRFYNINNTLVHPLLICLYLLTILKYVFVFWFFFQQHKQ